MTQPTLVICPRCSARHDSTARFCPSCGLDYQAVVANAAPRKKKGNRLGASTGALAILVGLGILYIVLNGGISLRPATSSTSLPPAGTIWFGSTFDAETFEIRDRTTTVSPTETFALVGVLTRSIDGSDLSIRAVWNGTPVYNQPAQASDFGEVWGFTYGPLFEAGTWTIEFTDIGGNVLASGTVTAGD